MGTKNKDDQKRRGPKTKTTKNKDDQQQRRPKIKTTKMKTTKIKKTKISHLDSIRPELIAHFELVFFPFRCLGLNMKVPISPPILVVGVLSSCPDLCPSACPKHK